MASKFVVKKKIPLDDLGEGWEQAFITFTPFSFRDNEKIISLRTVVLNNSASEKEAKKASDDIKDLLAEKLVEGKGFDGEKLIDITPENLPDLPMEVIVKVLTLLQGQTQISPKV